MVQITFKDMSPGDLDSFIARIEEAIKFDLSLDKEDLILLLEAFRACLFLQEKIEKDDLTILKLKKLLGMVSSSEKLSGLLGKKSEDSDKSEKSTKNRSRPQRQKPDSEPPFTPGKPEVEHHKLEGLSKGDQCPDCQQGKLYKYAPSQFVRIKGASPFTAVNHVLEKIKCNACDKYFTADLPPEVRKDGESGQKYGFSARTFIVLNKYFSGFPFYRQQNLQKLLGISIPASAQFDQAEYVANDIKPVFDLLKKTAANCDHFYLDDTRHKIVDQKPIMKKRRGSTKEQLRTGIFSSGVLASTKVGKEIALFRTNIGHAGEFMDEILRFRTDGLPPPRIMSDALSSNRPTITSVIWTKCNVHCRRMFYDLATQFEEESVFVLEEYQKVFQHEKETKNQKMEAPERLAHHIKFSLPIMKSLFKWCQEKLAQELVEENSSLGKACRYMLKNKDGLIKFCEIEGAMLHNNPLEQLLKMVVLGRKNFHWFKTAVGAAVSDTILSVVATAYRSGINVFQYITDLQQHSNLVKAAPENWLPWNYENTLSNISL